MKKVLDLFADFIKDKHNSTKISNIKFDEYCEMFDILMNIPKKPNSHRGVYTYYLAYKKYSKQEIEKRAEKTIKAEFALYNRFLKYLDEKEYLPNKMKVNLQKYYENTLKYLNSEVKKGNINAPKDTEALKPEMLSCIFSLENEYYKKNFNNLEKGKDDWTMFYVPLILFFTGARLAEIQGLTMDDVEIRDGLEDTVIYIDNNDIRGIKTSSSKRIVSLPIFLLDNLKFYSYYHIRKEKNEIQLI